MKELFAKGYAEIVPEDDLKAPGSVWYIPHFAVKHPKKGKLRIVFDSL